MKRSRIGLNVLVFFAIFCVAFLFRLPHFLSDNFWMDGDEAIVGLMAKDLIAGRNIPVYFYGQSYGFAFIEVISVSFWILILGANIWALKLGGLMIFSLAIFFFFQGLQRRSVDILTSVLICLLIVTFPTWTLWGLMVRGGYITAFLGLGLMYFFLSKQKIDLKGAVLLGISFGITIEGQVLILLPFLPFLIWELWNKRELNKVPGIFVLSGFSSVLILKGLNFNQSYWQGAKLEIDITSMINQLQTIFSGWIESFGNFYFFNITTEVSIWWYIALIALFILYLSWSIGFAFHDNRKSRLVFIFWLVTVMGVLGLVSISANYSPRYLLGVFSSLLFFVLYFNFNKYSLKFSRIFLALILVAQLSGLFVQSTLKRDWFNPGVNNVEAFKEMHEKVLELKPKALFTTDHFVQWTWNYYYGEEIPAIQFRTVDRIQFFADRVHETYRANSREVMIIGYNGVYYELDKLPDFNIFKRKINAKYFIQTRVSPDIYHTGVATFE